jgi:hypothetical protein
MTLAAPKVDQNTHTLNRRPSSAAARLQLEVQWGENRRASRHSGFTLSLWTRSAALPPGFRAQGSAGAKRPLGANFWSVRKLQRRPAPVPTQMGIAERQICPACEWSLDRFEAAPTPLGHFLLHGIVQLAAQGVAAKATPRRAVAMRGHWDRSPHVAAPSLSQTELEPVLSCLTPGSPPIHVRGAMRPLLELSLRTSAVQTLDTAGLASSWSSCLAAVDGCGMPSYLSVPMHAILRTCLAMYTTAIK